MPNNLHFSISPGLRKNILLTLLSLCIAFVMVEAALRISGIQPGMYIQSQWFNEVPTLALKQGFYADSNGIFKVDPASRDSIITRINRSYITNTFLGYNKDYEVPEIYGLIQETINLNTQKASTPFGKYIADVISVHPLDEADSAVLAYAEHFPVNEDGFRSIPFKNYRSTKKKILLLGDSFTWGHSSQPINNSFADLLLTKGFIVYNSGISGADPAQYLAIAKKYIPILKPDYVIVNFFVGNDVLRRYDQGKNVFFKRSPQPYTPIHYSTNAGNIISCPGGVYLNTPAEAYNFVVQQYRIPQNNMVNRLLTATACGTILWKVLNRFGWANNKNDYDWYWEKAKIHIQKQPTCKEEMLQINSLCTHNNSKFFLITINDILNPAWGSPDKFPGLFNGINYYPAPVGHQKYNQKDGHYNNEGHAEYADYVLQLINQHE